MRTLVTPLSVIVLAIASPAALACGDAADSHDDSFSQMTRPAPNATPIAKATDGKLLVAVKADKKAPAAVPAQPAPLKVAAARTPAN